MNSLRKMEASLTAQQVKKLDDGNFEMRLSLPGRWAAMVQGLAHYLHLDVDRMVELIAERWIELRERDSPSRSR